MINWKWAVLVFCVMLIVVIMYKHAVFANQLNGVWSATSEFCAMADLDSMVIVIGGGYFSKDMLVSMYKGDEMIFSKNYDITILPDLMPCTDSATMRICGTIDVMPTSPKITLNGSCRLVIGNSDKKYFEGIRY